MNREEIERSSICGCYTCNAIFSPTDIRLWSDSTDPRDDDPGALRGDHERYRGYTAVCPFCEDTSILGSASGLAITPALLTDPRAYWLKK
jgi:hypothetical protein